MASIRNPGKRNNGKNTRMGLGSEARVGGSGEEPPGNMPRVRERCLLRRFIMFSLFDLESLAVMR